MRRVLLIPVVTLLVAVAGCSTSGGSSGSATTTTARPTTSEASTTTASTTTTEAPSTTTTTATTTTTGGGDTPGGSVSLQFRPVIGSQLCSSVPASGPGAPSSTLPEGRDLLPDVEGQQCYGVGPVAGTQDDLAGATAQLGQAGDWQVQVTVKPGSANALNLLFDDCVAGAQTCPGTASGGNGAVAIVVDGKVVSAPAVNSKGLASKPFQISGSFTEAEARDLAAKLGR